MSETHWHHFVAAMYLRGFLDPEKVTVCQNVLCVYEQNKKVRPKGPDRIAGEQGFNYTPETPGFEDSTEKALAGPARRGGHLRSRSPRVLSFWGRVVHGDLGHLGGRPVARIHAEGDQAQAVDCRRLFL